MSSVVKCFFYTYSSLEFLHYQLVKSHFQAYLVVTEARFVSCCKEQGSRERFICCDYYGTPSHMGPPTLPHAIQERCGDTEATPLP